MGFDFSEPLMQWKEPSSFQQNKRLFYILFITCLAGIVLCIFAIKFIPTTPGQKGNGLIILLPLLALMGVFIFFFGRSKVALQENGIAWAGGKSAAFSRYDEIESCRAELLSFPDAKFYSLKFVIRDPNKFRIVSPLSGVILPKEIEVSSVLDFLRNRGVKIIEDPKKLSS